ncbi:MAG: PEGA domain-containing protein [Planctomycetota bacterium]|jgi:hypothetical protein|nr:PEGA domain-containing protein [Planctomycetota bacterium]
MVKKSRFFLALALLALSGCVERALVITSEPSGASITVNQQWKGTTPFVVPFKHYGVYDIWIEHPGYLENGKKVSFYPLHVGEPVNAPAYQRLGTDFVSEVLLPARLSDQHSLHYVLERVDLADEIDDVLARAGQLRSASNARNAARREQDQTRRRNQPAEGENPSSGQPSLEAGDYDSDFDATPPNPEELPVFTNY